MENRTGAHPYCDVCRKVGHFTQDCTKHLRDSARGVKALLDVLNEVGRAKESSIRRLKDSSGALEDGLKPKE